MNDDEHDAWQLHHHGAGLSEVGAGNRDVVMFRQGGSGYHLGYLK